MTETRMSSYIKRIATGPKMSKDLSRDEARDGMELILNGDVEAVQAGVFLIALRMKRESDEENLGILDALLAHTQRVSVEVDELVHIADPYDGFLRHLPPGPFLPAVLAACGLPAITHGCEQLGPKFGLTHHQVLRAAGIRTNLSPEEAATRVADPDVAWAYVDQAQFLPKLHHLTELRRLIVKRPCLATLEKFCGPVRARKDYLAVGYVHTAYEDLLPLVALHAGYDLALIMRGIEGGVTPPLNAPSKLLIAKPDTPTQLIRLAPREAGINTEIRSAPLPEELTADESVDLLHYAQLAAQAGLAALSGADGPLRNSLILAAAAILHHLGRAGSLLMAAEYARKALDSGTAHKHFRALAL